MATKRYNQQSFSADVNGRSYNFKCYTTHTRCGFCHTAQTWSDYRNIASDTKISYFNRTWERFDYEKVLNAAIAKCPKADQEQLRDIIIERKAQKEHEEAEKFIGRFQAMHSALNDKNKKLLADTVGVIESPAQAGAAMAVGMLMLACQGEK